MLSGSGRPLQRLLVTAATWLGVLLAALAGPVTRADDLTFIRVGFLPGDGLSAVYSVNDAGTLAACISYRFDPHRTFTDAACWTPGEGLQPLPRLLDNPATSALPYVAGKDVTNDGSRIVFTGITADGIHRGAAIANADGSGLLDLTALPNGEKLQSALQISDDGLTVFGYSVDNQAVVAGAYWTAAGGIQALLPPAGFNTVFPARTEISSDGRVSVGDIYNYDPNTYAYTDFQAYRWTPELGVLGLGFLPGGTTSRATALSANGEVILGTSDTTINPAGYGYSTHLFRWTVTGGMEDLGLPQHDARSVLGPAAAGLSGDGVLAVIPLGNGSNFLLNTSYPYYFSIAEILAQTDESGATAGWSNFTTSGMTDDGNTIYGMATNPEGRPEGFIARFTPGYLRNLVPPLPVITSANSDTATVGQEYSYTVTATGMPESFDASGLPAGLTFSNGYKPFTNIKVGIISGNPSKAGVYHLTTSATNVRGTGSATLSLTVAGGTPSPTPTPTTTPDPTPSATPSPSSTPTATPSPSASPTPVPTPPAAELLNISTRAQVQNGDDVLIGGFIVAGSTPKKVVVRAIGPSLARSGISNLLSDPVLTLHKPDRTTVTNDDWKEAQPTTELINSGLAPEDDREPALVATLEAGAYTAVITGKNGSTGVALVEIYDLDRNGVSRLANISTRGLVGTGENVLIGGVIVGEEGANILVRALGPTLQDLGIANSLLDPLVELYDENGVVIAVNDDWRQTQEAALDATRLPPTDDRESALLATLPHGNYTAIVRGKSESTGAALIEFYQIE
ncbi:hypothetical protein BH20VER3_BH20VER3_04670 [soil metagenome]